MSFFDRWRSPRDDADDEERGGGELARLLERARALPVAREPARDLWSGIENRLASQRGAAAPAGLRDRLAAAFPRPAVAAVAATVLVAATVTATLWVVGPATPSDAEVRAIAHRLRERDGVSEIHESLRAILDERRGELPAATVAALEENLDAIDRALAEIHLALEAHPDDPALPFLLAEAYHREAELLERLEWWTRGSGEARS